MKKYFIFISILLFIFLFLSGSRTYAQNFSRQIESSSLKPGEAVPGEIIVEYNKGQSPTELRQKVSERAQASKSLFGRVENYASDARAALQGQETPEKMLNEINNVNGKAGIKEKEEILPSIEVIKTTNTISPQALQDMYENLPEVKHAQLNYILKASDISDDTYYPQMWGLAKIQIEQAWNITKGSKDIIIAVIDSGIDYNHEDLPQDIIKGPNYINDTYNPMDDGGHGTHVSGTIGALANNSKGITGIDWQAKIMAIKILGANGEGNTANLIEAIVYAADNGAKVINMSVGVDLGAGTSCLSNDPITQSAITYAKQKKVTIIVAAGNDSKNASTWTPASCNGVLTVGATDPDDKRTAYSNYGNAVKISAPGGDFDQCAVNNQISFSACAPKTILSTFPRAINPCPPGACGGLPDRTYNYALLQGTSMAAPHVAGVAALVLTVNPRLAPDDVMRILIDSADPITTDQPIGKRLNAYKAVLAASQTVNTPTPTPTPSPVSQPTLYFAQEGSTTPLQSISFSPGQSIPLSLYYSTPNTPINGYDITVTAPSNLAITNIADGSDAEHFDTSLIEANNINTVNNSVRIAKIITSASNANSNTTLRLAVITFTAASLPTNDSQAISFSGPQNSLTPAIVSSTNTESFVSITTSPFSYTIGQESIAPTPTGSQTVTQFTFSLALTGIGQDGNGNPLTTQRPVEIELFDSRNEPLPIKTGTVSFNSLTNRFGLLDETIDMGSLAEGNYIIKVKTPRYLKKLIPGIQTITSNRTTPYAIPPVTLIVGDANNDNKLDILDFNILYSCFRDKSCNNKDSVDFDDDGQVDGVDYNLYLRSVNVKEGD